MEKDNNGYQPKVSQTRYDLESGIEKLKKERGNDSAINWRYVVIATPDTDEGNFQPYASSYNTGVKSPASTKFGYPKFNLHTDLKKAIEQVKEHKGLPVSICCIENPAEGQIIEASSILGAYDYRLDSYFKENPNRNILETVQKRTNELEAKEESKEILYENDNAQEINNELK